MEAVLGALPNLLRKLGELLTDEYNLQKGVKLEIRILQDELESMKGALEDISKTPPDHLPSQDKIWARNVRALSYDIEDNIDTFRVQVKGSEPANSHGFKKFFDKILDTLAKAKIRHKISSDIKKMKRSVLEVHGRRIRYKVEHSVDKPIKVDPRALVRYEDVKKLVGIDEARDKVIKLLMEGDVGSKQNAKTVSIVGFGGLGKTALANVVYEKLRAQFIDCSAFVSVSQTPDMEKILKDMFFELTKKRAGSISVINVINELRQLLLQKKRYFIIIDDIWETSDWDVIKSALPNVSDEHIIITTTRKLTVAEHIGGVFKMMPLSLENSRILMYRRIFGEQEKGKCPDEQLVEVTHKILNKCAGVPLAIITIASLLASKGRNKLEWYNVCNSIGTGLKEDNNNLDNMRKVLSLSYYDMPSHLKCCLLYLSMFPEDFKVDTCRLIRLWMAEGFIQPREQVESLFETGESYLIELINRSMIQPAEYDKHLDKVVSCHVHDMVLDLICFLSSEENFSTVWKGMGQPSSSISKNVRRLSLQNSKADHCKPEATMSVERVRTVIVFPLGIDHAPTLQNLSVLRVLHLEGCDLSQGNRLKYLGNLLHLRYLVLRDTKIDQLPEEIGNLRFLQTLEVWQEGWGNGIYSWGKGISSWSSTIVLLTRLICLHLDGRTMTPKGIRSLTSLEDLKMFTIGNDSADIIEELGHLTELKSLCIYKHYSLREWNDGLTKSLVESLNKLHKIQDLSISCSHVTCLDGWVVPPHLRNLDLRGCRWFSTLPAWVSHSHLQSLFVLKICLRQMQQEDLEILGKLPSLRSLLLSVNQKDLGIINGRYVVGAGLFPCLLDCWFKGPPMVFEQGVMPRLEKLYLETPVSGFGRPVMFEQGAMPRLADLSLELPVQQAREISGVLQLGLGNLLSLEIIDVCLVYTKENDSKEEREEAKAMVAQVIEGHPNRPTISFSHLGTGF